MTMDDHLWMTCETILKPSFQATFVEPSGDSLGKHFERETLVCDLEDTREALLGNLGRHSFVEDTLVGHFGQERSLGPS